METKPTAHAKPTAEHLNAQRDETVARFAEIKGRCDELMRDANTVRGEIADLDARREQLAARLKDLKRQAKSAEMEIVAIAREMGHAVEKGDSAAPLQLA